jgi:hypothetical protein
MLEILKKSTKKLLFMMTLMLAAIGFASMSTAFAGEEEPLTVSDYETYHTYVSANPSHYSSGWIDYMSDYAAIDREQSDQSAIMSAWDDALSNLVFSNQQALTDVKAIVEGLDSNDYTEGSWGELQTAYDAAVIVLPGTTRLDITNMIDAIEDEIDTLVLQSYVDLQAKLGESYTEALYTVATWTPYADALSDGQDVYDNSESTNQDYLDAIDAINTAVNGFVTVLEIAEERITGFTETLYTETSWDAVTDAQGMVEGTDQEKIDKADAINTALDNLVLQSKADLQQTLANEYTETLYTEATWTPFAAALSDGQDVYDDSESTNEDYLAAIQAIESALENLKLQSKEDLELLLADDFTEALYTEATWAPYESALSDGQVVLDDIESSNADFENAVQAIEDAILNLETVLDAAEERLLTFDPNLYTQTTWSEVLDALTMDEVTDQEQIDKAAAINTALDDLVTVLEEAEDRVLTYDPSLYTETTWSEVDDALAMDENTVQEKIDKAAAINTALDNLVLGGYEYLQEAITEASMLNWSIYTQESINLTWGPLYNALKITIDQTGKTDLEINQEQVAKANAIYAALDNLVTKDQQFLIDFVAALETEATETFDYEGLIATMPIDEISGTGTMVDLFAWMAEAEVEILAIAGVEPTDMATVKQALLDLMLAEGTVISDLHGKSISFDVEFGYEDADPIVETFTINFDTTDIDQAYLDAMLNEWPESLDFDFADLEMDLTTADLFAEISGTGLIADLFAAMEASEVVLVEIAGVEPTDMATVKQAILALMTEAADGETLLDLHNKSIDLEMKFAYGQATPTTVTTTYTYITYTLDTDAPTFVEATAEGNIYLSENDTFVWSFQANDMNLYELEIDHNFEGTLPEFSVYASEENPYGTEADRTEFESYGVIVTYDATTQTWTIDFGQTVTDLVRTAGQFRIYTTVSDIMGNKLWTMDPTDVENTFVYDFIYDIEAPVLIDVTEEGHYIYNAEGTFEWMIQVSDDNLFSLEIDHNIPSLPEFTVYASETDPYGGQFAAFDAAGVTVEFDATSQTWTIDFGDLTQDLIDNETFKIYVVVEDLAGNEFGTMYGTTPENTFVYTLERDIDAPVLGEFTPAEGEVILGDGETFVWTIQFTDPNLAAIEIDHSMENSIPEFWLHANEENPYGTEADRTEFESYGVIVTYDATTQTWTIDFGENVTPMFIENGGITFYVKAFDVVGNAFGSMDPTTPENTFAYTIVTRADKDIYLAEWAFERLEAENGVISDVTWRYLTTAVYYLGVAQANENVDPVRLAALEAEYAAITSLDMSNQVFVDRDTDMTVPEEASGVLIVFENLETLNLSNTGITNVGGFYTSEMISLINVDLSENPDLEIGAAVLLAELEGSALATINITNTDYEYSQYTRLINAIGYSNVEVNQEAKDMYLAEWAFGRLEAVDGEISGVTWRYLTTAVFYYETALANEDVDQTRLALLTEQFEAITSLDMSNQVFVDRDTDMTVPEEASGVLIHFVNLETLNLSNTGITNVGGLFTSAMVSIVDLDLSENPTLDIEAAVLLAELEESALATINITNTAYVYDHYLRLIDTVGYGSITINQEAKDMYLAEWAFDRLEAVDGAISDVTWRYLTTAVFYYETALANEAVDQTRLALLEAKYEAITSLDMSNQVFVDRETDMTVPEEASGVLIHFVNLETLNLSNTGITNVGGLFTSEMLTLVDVDLSENPTLNIEAAVLLAELEGSALESINITNTDYAYSQYLRLIDTIGYGSITINQEAKDMYLAEWAFDRLGLEFGSIEGITWRYLTNAVYYYEIALANDDVDQDRLALLQAQYEAVTILDMSNQVFVDRETDMTVPEEASGLFIHFTNLVILDLSNTGITNIGGLFTTPLTSLVDVNLINNPGLDIGALVLLAELEESLLEYVDITNTDYSYSQYLRLVSELGVNNVGANEASYIQLVQDGTTMAVVEGDIVATFPTIIPSFFDEAGYSINSIIEVTEDIEYSVTIIRGEIALVFADGLDAGTYTYTELVAMAFDVTEPEAADFVAATYNEQVETYEIRIAGNLFAFETTINIQSVISNDGFVNTVVLAELVYDLSVEADQNALDLVDQNLQDAKNAAYSLNGADYTFPSFVASWYHLDQAMVLPESTIEEKIAKTEAINYVLDEILITNQLWSDFLTARTNGQEALTTYADFEGQANYIALENLLTQAQDMAINALMNALDETMDPMTREDVNVMIDSINDAIEALEADQETAEQLAALNDSIQAAIDYQYDPVYNYLFESIDLEDTTITVEYLQSVLLAYMETAPEGRNYDVATGAFHDLARFFGGLDRAALSTVETIIWNSTEYTVDPQGTLLGSNWVDAQGNTLMEAIANDFINLAEPWQFVLVDEFGNEITLTFVLNITMDVYESNLALQATPENALGYTYDDYDYLYDQVIEDTIYYTESILIANNSEDPLSGVMTDLARYLGALYRVEGSVVESIVYRNITFVWNEQGTLKGSNWVMEQDSNVSLVAAVVAGYDMYPNDPIELVLIDQFGNEVELSLSFVIDPDVSSIINLGQTVADAITYEYDPTYEYKYEDITLENNTITVDYLQSVLEAYQETAPEGRTFTFNAAMFHDLARILGAMEYSGGTVETIIWNETEYTWNPEGTLKGSNWIDEFGNTLMAAIATMYPTETAYDQMVFTLVDTNDYQIDLTVIFNVEFDRYQEELNQLETEINNLVEADYTVSSWEEADFTTVLAMPEETQAEMAAKIVAMEEELDILKLSITVITDVTIIEEDEIRKILVSSNGEDVVYDLYVRDNSDFTWYRLTDSAVDGNNLIWEINNFDLGSYDILLIAKDRDRMSDSVTYRLKNYILE